MFSLSLTVVQRNEYLFSLLNLGSASVGSDGESEAGCRRQRTHGGAAYDGQAPLLRAGAVWLCKTIGSVHKAANAACCAVEIACRSTHLVISSVSRRSVRAMAPRSAASSTVARPAFR